MDCLFWIGRFSLTREARVKYTVQKREWLLVFSESTVTTRDAGKRRHEPEKPPDGSRFLGIAPGNIRNDINLGY